MVAPIGINTNTYSQANATRNMQQVGGQSQVTRKNDVAPQSEAHNTAAADNVQPKISLKKKSAILLKAPKSPKLVPLSLVLLVPLKKLLLPKSRKPMSMVSF